MLSRIFRFGQKKNNKKVHLSDSNDDSWLENFHLTERGLPNLERSQIRILVFKDHDKKGDKCVLFDSKTAIRVETQQPTTENARPRRRLSSDVPLLGEMIFGSVEMTYKGPTVKVHSIRTPPQLLLTKVFALKPLRAGSHSSSTTQSMSDYLQTSSKFTESVSGSVSSQKSLNTSSDNEEHLIAKSVPVFMHSASPCHSVQLQNVVEGFSNSTSGSSHSSLNATFPRTSSGSYQRRWLRSQATRMDYGCHRRNESFNDEMSMRLRRRPKIGIGVLFSLWEDKDTCEENNRLFQSFCFSHFPIIESHVHQLKRRIEKALLTSLQMSGKSIQDAVLNATNIFADSILNLYYVPRIRNPVWLTMLSQPDQCDAICEDLVPQLVNAIEMYNTKETNFFMTSLLTAVLTYHVAWVTTVTPSPAQARRAYLDKHSSEALNVLGESHPYNPLWAQLSDLYGAGGDPTRTARTVILGKDRNLVTVLLHILSYFIRCSEVYEQSMEQTPKFPNPCLDSLSLSTPPSLSASCDETESHEFPENSEKILQSSENMSQISEGKVELNSEKILQNSEENLENAEKIIENSEENIENSEKSIENSEKNLENSEKSIENCEKNLENCEKVLESCEKNLETSERNLKNSEKILEQSQSLLQVSEKRLEQNSKGKTSCSCMEKSFCERCNKLTVTVNGQPIEECLLERSVEACSCSGVFTGNSKENKLWKSFLRTSCCDKTSRSLDGVCLSKNRLQESVTNHPGNGGKLTRRHSSDKKLEHHNYQNGTFCIQNEGKTISLDRQSIVTMFLSSFPLCPICQGQLSFSERDDVFIKDDAERGLVDSGFCSDCEKLKACCCRMMNSEFNANSRCGSSATMNSDDYSSGISCQSFEAERGSLSSLSIDSGLNVQCLQSTENGDDKFPSVAQPYQLDLPKSGTTLDDEDVLTNSLDYQLFSFGRSLMAGYCDQYLPDFVLHGTEDCIEEQLKYDLKISLEQPVVDSPILESVIIVGNTNNWECRIQSQKKPRKGVGNYPAGGYSKKGECSRLVYDFLTSFCSLWEMNMSSQFCLMHLEDKMKEIYLRSKVISEYLLTQKKYVTMRDLMSTFGYGECDLALLMSVIGVHSPPAISRIPVL